jgi:NADH:ubiquinone oxidoreductase subunit 4 (subunit M)
LSIFLSGVLVKLSIYGILKFLYLSPIKLNFTLFYYLAVIGVIDSTLKMLIQIDSKVVIAFSTTVQMNLICFILFSLTTESLQTLKLGLVNHLLTASILFFFADQILVRFNTREFFFLCGIYYFLPALSAMLTLFIINQINFPGFLGFFLDIYFLSTSLPDYFGTSFFLFFFLFVIEHLYILFFFLKILYGTSLQFKSVIFKDLSYDEVALSVFLLASSFLFGTFPLTLTVIL